MDTNTTDRSKQPAGTEALALAPCSAIREMHLGTMTDEEQRRCLEIGTRIPSLRWWYSTHDKLGCSPRAAVDAGRFAEVEALLPNVQDEPRPL